MRKTLLMTMLLGISTQVGAQQLSAGYKTGINNWMRINTTHKGPILSEVKDGARISWNNEVFIRYQTKGNWALEGGMNYSKRNTDGIYYIDCFDCNGWKEENISASYTELNLGLQYKLDMPCAQLCPILSKLTNFIGVSISPQLVNIVTEYTPNYIGTGLLPNSTRHGAKHIAISAGINHTIVYNISNQFNAISTVSIKYIPDGRYNATSNTRAGVSVGASYNIN